MNIMDVDISPTRLSSTGSTPSRDAGALNRQDAVCPHITDWLTTGTRKGHWVCADAGNCKYQHECKGGRECDAEVCHLRHPAEQSRWIVCANKKERWVLSMFMDEALHYQVLLSRIDPGPKRRGTPWVWVNTQSYLVSRSQLIGQRCTLHDIVDTSRPLSLSSPPPDLRHKINIALD